MKLADYLKDRRMVCLIDSVTWMFIVIFLVAFHVNVQAIVIVSVLLLLSVFIAGTWDFLRKKQYYDKLLHCLEELDKKYLLPEMLEEPQFLDGRILCDVMQETDKSMCEHIAEYRRENAAFREYIELWVHEIKLPVANLQLMCHNAGNMNDPEYGKNADEDNVQNAEKNVCVENGSAKNTEKNVCVENGSAKNTEQSMCGGNNNVKYSEQLKRIDDYIENVLYYARSRNAEKDYLIKPVSLKRVFTDTALRNREELQERGISLYADALAVNVMTDAKWLGFILGQLMSNSMKYEADEIRVRAEEYADKTILHFRDNGIGIPQRDLPYIFEKSFTGENGRTHTKSTGMGLYIVKQLCRKLGHTVGAESVEGEYTEIILTFGKNDLHEVL